MVAAEAARAIVPESFEGYAVNLAPELVKYVGEATDPAMKALREHAAAEKWPQGRFDDTMNLIKVFSEKGVLAPMFDPAAEAAKLGENAGPRRQEVEVLAKNLKERGEINEDEFGEMNAFAATAAGVTLFEKLRKMMGPNGTVQPIAPGPGDAPQASEGMAAAQALRLDAKYGKDGAFTRAADKAWIAAFEADKAAK